MIVRDAFQNSSPWMQLFFMIASVVLVFLLFFSGGLLLGGVIFSMSPADLVWVMGDVSDPGRGPVLKYFQVVQTFGLFVGPSLLLAWLYSSRPLAYLRLAPLPPAGFGCGRPWQ
jgi:archaellum biogenesis protein FlaJ (TadC family)